MDNNNETRLREIVTERKRLHSDRCSQECTRDVVFLFQRRRFNLIGLPAGFDCTECYIDFDKSRDEYADDLDDHGIPADVAARLQGDGIPLREFAELDLEFGEWGQSCVTEEWITEGVWLDRAEATQYGERRAYNYPDGWRVYGVPSYGKLADELRQEGGLAELVEAVLRENAALRSKEDELRMFITSWSDEATSYMKLCSKQESELAALRARCEGLEGLPRLCYVQSGVAYFTTQKLADQWGDDWNDAPWEHSAGTPYSPCWHNDPAHRNDPNAKRGWRPGTQTPLEPGELCRCKSCVRDWNDDGSPKWTIVELPFTSDLGTPDEALHISISVEQINRGMVAWLMDRWGSSGVVIPAGVTIPEFVRLVNLSGGSVDASALAALKEAPRA